MLIDAHVVLRDGPLEFFACFGGKEHESILRLDATAESVLMALGLIGQEPGAPHAVSPDGRYIPPRGALLDVSVEKSKDAAEPVDQETPADPAHTWVQEIEFQREALARPWVFAGSIRLPNGKLSADVDGFGIGLVSHRDNLLSLSAPHSVSDAALWAQAATERIPPIDTKVVVRIAPANRKTPTVRLRANGTIEIDGRFSREADLLDIIQLQELSGRGEPPEIRCERGALRADQRRIRRLLRDNRFADDSIRFVAED
ncbi:MAG: hypothetical protein KDA32_09210 [Phycisphaerales bacterium]|nr:hypothetical protein [Phycisphaerales bacterium]